MVSSEFRESLVILAHPGIRDATELMAAMEFLALLVHAGQLVTRVLLALLAILAVME
jgi:hypothetical protein